MRNLYLTSYFPLLSIIMFSLSFAIHVQMLAVNLLKKVGIYDGMREFFSDGGIRLALLILFLVLFFMIFAALKLIADTINELSLLFFSNDSEGNSLKQIRTGSIIYFIGGALSLVSIFYLNGIILILLSTTVIYFIFFVYKISATQSLVGILGLVFFQVIVWSSLLIGVFYLALKVYNSFIASLPI